MARTPSERWRRSAATASIVLGTWLAVAAPSAAAELRVLACEPSWASLVRELGGERVHVDSATTPLQDPHSIQARPSLISKLRRADLLVCSGADLEIGWLPVLLRRAANADVQPGQPGSLEITKHVPMRDVPADVDRSMGDVHPYGNPHVELDPRNVALAAAELARRLAQLDPEGAAHYREQHADFAARWEEATARWSERAAPLRGHGVVTHHADWTYLIAWLGLEEVARLEPKPGIPPSASHLAALLERTQGREVLAILRKAYEPARPAEWFSERTGAPVLVLPHAPAGEGSETPDLFAVFDAIVGGLLAELP